ncbi:MAG: DMT family transporter, partial [Erysipelotrichia bacterium]|nr:DMT family transporter [Erysipelotrichia bacterium]
GVDDALAHGWQTFPLLAFRGLIGGLFMLIFSYRKKWWKNKTTIILGIITGTLFFAGFAFQTLGQTLSSVPNTAFITTLNVIFVPLIARIFLKRKIENKVYVACFLAIIGTAILSFSDSFTFHIGDIYLLLCAIFFALQILFNEKCGQHNDVMSITCIQLLTMGILSFLFMPMTNQTHIPNESWGSILFLALFSSALASVFQLYGQGHVEPSKASLILSLESILATLFSVLLLGQTLTLSIIIGGTCMFSAVILVEYKRKNV